jgi:NAD-dependent dihydropyrimidine dehydrogenase PreA subunit
MMRYLRNVVTLELDAAKCTGCTMCTIVCPHAVFEMRSSKAVIIDRDACMECGACALNCPAGAIAVEAGVGCAAAMIQGAIRGTEPQCGPGCCGEPDDGGVEEVPPPCCAGPEKPRPPCCGDSGSRGCSC